MKIILGVIIFLMLSSTAKAADLSLWSANIATLADGYTSYRALQNPNVHESNFIYGEHPSNLKILLITGLRIGGIFYTNNHLSKKKAKRYNIVFTLIGGGAAINNYFLFK